jgi:hypothetical protein
MSTTVNPLTAISTWSIDPARSSVHFKVRHMMISNIRGEFRTVRRSEAERCRYRAIGNRHRNRYLVHPYARRV